MLTWLIAAQTVLTYLLAQNHLDNFPSIAKWATLLATGIGAVIVMLRQLAPIPTDQVKGIIEASTATVTTSPKS